MAEESILSSIVKGVERLPGNIVGAPVDISNLVLGAVTGKGMSGFSERPIGGSEQLNSMFGLGNSGTVPTSQTVTELVTGLINPASAAKTAMIVGLPVAMRTGSAMEKFAKMEQAGATAPEMFAATRIFAGDDKLLRTAVADNMAFVKVSGIETLQDGSPGIKFVPQMGATIESVFGHPILKQYPELRNIKVDVMAGKPGEAAYNKNSNTIFLAPAGVQEIQTAILHELQHAVQKVEGFKPGTSVQAQATSEELTKSTKLRALANNPKFAEEKNLILDRAKAVMKPAEQRYATFPGEQEAQFTEIMQDKDQRMLDEIIHQLLIEGRNPQNWRTKDAPLGK